MLGWINIDKKSAENLCRLFGCLRDYDEMVLLTSDENLLSERIMYKIDAGRNSVALRIERFFRVEKKTDEKSAKIIKNKRTLSAVKYI